MRGGGQAAGGHGAAYLSGEGALERSNRPVAQMGGNPAPEAVVGPVHDCPLSAVNGRAQTGQNVP
ncbi:MAG: hypothetical protein OZSIB_2181 [Candidatus Ozemobacter sibiricus]|uniref:Uncharacterized protein n=1 Tax=Candidatus Ozemobacter sibiricus TaxID=2268124 RepID=A0A367ZVD3_9BACT|nr:MAG: hypothetical protein OZSIB_2181 [Candidatus Ozemobacter sibiricus]